MIINAINAICVISIIYCIARIVFIKQDYDIIGIEKISDDDYIITVKRLWKVYKYYTDHNLYVDDADNGIQFKLRKKENSYENNGE